MDLQQKCRADVPAETRGGKLHTLVAAWYSALAESVRWK